MSALEVAWRVNVWNAGAWAPYYGESGSRVNGRVDYVAAERNVRKCFDEVSRRGMTARLSCRYMVIGHRNLDRLTKEQADAAFFDNRIRGAAFPCEDCRTLTTFLPLRGTRRCGGARCQTPKTKQEPSPHVRELGSFLCKSPTPTKENE